MKTRGIRISDEIQQDLVVNDLSLILEEISNGADYFWSILFLEAYGRGKENIILDNQNSILSMSNGYLLDWKDLYKGFQNIDRMYDIILIGCKDKSLLHRYKTDREMFETCDIVITFIDSSYWEIFSKDQSLLWRLANKFKKIEWIESDYIP